MFILSDTSFCACCFTCSQQPAWENIESEDFYAKDACIITAATGDSLVLHDEVAPPRLQGPSDSAGATASAKPIAPLVNCGSPESVGALGVTRSAGPAGNLKQDGMFGTSGVEHVMVGVTLSQSYINSLHLYVLLLFLCVHCLPADIFSIGLSYKTKILAWFIFYIKRHLN